MSFAPTTQTANPSQRQTFLRTQPPRADRRRSVDQRVNLEVNLTDSTLAGSANTEGDGSIDITLENSTWNVTGDSNTNGKLTADSDSHVDFHGTTDTITVIIDSLAGDPDISMKVGDTLIIRNSDGSITDITSSNSNVVEVVKDPVTGEITIISKGNGNALVTITHSDGSKTTIGITSGNGCRSGSSSGCNAGFGALFALVGLALVYKKK